MNLRRYLQVGRLSASSRTTIAAAYDAAIAAGKGTTEAVVNVQQLIVTTPEFHTNGLTSATGQFRPEPAPQTPTTNPYKGVIYVMLEGGYDSYNMLAPHTCVGTNAEGVTIRQQYDCERGLLSFNEGSEQSLLINAAGQPCTDFAIHDELTVVKELYDNQELIFFAKTGAINSNGNG